MFNLEVLAFVLYFVCVLGIGLFFFLKSKDNGEKDYFLGGRSMGPWVTAMSAQASDMSAWLLMGLPGSIMAFGLGQMWIGVGLALGTIANWVFVAKRLRRFSEAAGDSITVPQYLTNRFASKSNALQIISAIIFLICFTVYVASAFVAGSSILTSLFPGLGNEIATIIFAIIILAYTFLGGFKAVCWTDFFQGLLMIVALVSVPIVIVATKEIDTTVLSQAVTNVNDNTEYIFSLNAFGTGWQEVVSGLAWGLGYFGMPHIIVRFMSIKKASMVKKSAVVACVWVVISLAAALLMGYFGRMFFGAELLTVGMQKNIFIEFARDLFPVFIAGILMSAMVAASMSTADSQLLVASSSFTSDIYKPIFRKKASDKELLWIGRGVVVIVAIIAYFIATSKGQGAQAIMNMVENAWAGFGSSFGPVIILSLFWKRTTYKGVIAGVLGGAITDVLWFVFLTKPTGIYELLPGFAVGLICCVVGSLIDKAPSKEVEAIFEAATSDEDRMPSDEDRMPS